MFKRDDVVTLIPNGIDTSFYKYDNEYRNEMREKYNLKDYYIIGQVGRLSYQKNQEFSTKLIERLVEHIPNAKLFLVGKNQDDSTYQLIKNNPHIIYIGEVDDISKYYSAFDVAIMPSKFEGAPLSLLEALSNGLDVLISDNVPYPEHISNNVHQLPLDIDIWVKEILNLKKDRTTKPVDGIDKYDSTTMAKRYLDFYRGL
jgi:glycosyltransferase involved in cell wall biosynthesis